jgi:O-antigen ligase
VGEQAAVVIAVPRVRWGLLPSMILLCILPFAHTVALRLACLFVGFLIAAPVLLRERRTLPCRWPIVLWAAVCLASVAWSVRPDYSIGEWRSEVVYPLLTFFTLYATTRADAAWRASAWSLAAGFLVVAGSAASYLWSPQAWIEPGALLGDVNHVSTYLVLVAPAFAAFALQEPATASRLRMPLIAGVTLFIVTGWLTQNRTLWLALAVQTTLFAALYLWRAVPQRERSVRGLLTVGVICAAMLVLFTLSSFNKSGAMPVDAEGLKTNLEQSVRPQIWRLVFERWTERPLLGYGFGREILGEELVRLGGRFATHSHNIFLNSALETGVMGLASLVLLFASLAGKFRALLLAGDRDTRIIAIAGLCLLAGALIKSTTDIALFRGNGLLFWALLGMFLGRVRGREIAVAPRFEMRP